MKALSIKQPWAWLICAKFNGLPIKDMENRDWRIPTSFKLPQRIYVHAGKTPDEWYPAIDIVRKVYGTITGMNLWDKFINWQYKNGQSIMFPSQNTSLIIGEVDITDCVDKSDSPWFVGKYGFVLAKPKLYDKPIPYKGQLGFFEVTLPQ